LVIEPTQTRVEFTLGSLLHTVHGDFQLKRGTLRFDSQSGIASGELVVDATSGESGSAARDKRMHASILESARYPKSLSAPITWRATSLSLASRKCSSTLRVSDKVEITIQTVARTM
jgi:hypothetical protein